MSTITEDATQNLVELRIGAESPTSSATQVPCPYCAAPVHESCRTAAGRELPRKPHDARWRSYASQRKSRQMWFVMLADDPGFRLAAGDIVRAVKYPHDAKVTVLFREEDGFDPECNQYLSAVGFLGFVPRDMEVH